VGTWLEYPAIQQSLQSVNRMVSGGGTAFRERDHLHYAEGYSMGTLEAHLSHDHVAHCGTKTTVVATAMRN
jgi:hypothetical protein